MRAPTREDGRFVGYSLSSGKTAQEVALQLSFRGIARDEARVFVEACQRQIALAKGRKAHAVGGAESTGTRLFEEGMLLIALGVLITAGTFVFAHNLGGFYVVAFGPMIAGGIRVIRSIT